MKASDLIVNGELILSGYVLLDDYVGWMWEEDVFFSPRMVREALASIGEGEVTVRLNSSGGHPDAGEQIRTILLGHPGGCTIVVEGLAASAASLLFMAGKRRLMSAGSHLMIHDPSGGAWGTEAQLHKEAEVLGAMANTYAAVYGEASGKSAEEVREIMKAETWYGPEAAIAAGFADGIAEAGAPAEGATMEIARAAFMAAGEAFKTLMARKPQGAGRPSSIEAEPVAMTATTDPKEITMTTSTTAPSAPAAPPVAPAPQMAATPDLVAQERARAKAIRDMAAPHVASGRLTQDEVNALIDDGTSMQDAGVKFMAIMANAEPEGRSTGPVTITRDETETKMEGMIGALMRRTDGPAADYRGMKLRRLAMELSGNQRGHDEIAMIRAGMRATTMMGGAYGVSDFAYITTEVMRRSLIADYERRAPTWQMVTGVALSASDFREIHAARFGGDFSLKPVAPNGEYQTATLQDEAEGLKVERRGRTIKLTFEAVVNDDLGAFLRIPRDFALAARTMESSIVWSLFRSNAVLKSDSKALFHADHKNLGTAATLNPTSVGAGRKAMWEQRAFGSKDKDDFLEIVPDRILVPPALELLAMQFVTASAPTKDEDINPFKNTLGPVTVPNIGAEAGGSDTAWYLISSDMPPISHAYLEGYEAPSVETIDGMNPDVVTMNARHIFGAAASEFRGAYKNPGL